ncbi:hypothetical protein pipiens_004084 [Culex pipiens pipiens]|uniref:Peptidase S1 domain-containing protein n=1 Tax=Culex pipiens pipiens TaxID=38569 RepID=A0ABD1CNP6_CULPP
MIGSSVSRRTEEVFCVLLIAVFIVAKAGVLGQETAETDDDGDDVVESTSPGSPRVVGGTGVAIGELPFICSVRQRQPAGSWSSWTHLCGSTIVNENWLLTSAHCVAPPLPKESLLIVCGVRQARTVAGIEPSPGYVDGQRGSDLALILLKKPLVFTGNVQPIPIFDQRILPTSVATIVGYGVSSYGKDGWQPNGLEAATVPILSMKACIRRLGTLATYLTDDTICTDVAGPTGAAGTCVGDSGGPVIIGTELHPFNLLAIPAWTVTPCGSGPSMHTLVSAHIEWILSVIVPNLK